MKAQSVRLVGETQKAYAKRLIDEAPATWVMELGEETRRQAQNRKLHPMCQDCIDQTERFKGYAMEDCKQTFLNALRGELKFLTELEGQGLFPVGNKTSTLSVTQFSGLVDLIYEWGNRNGVAWSEREERIAA